MDTAGNRVPCALSFVTSRACEAVRVKFASVVEVCLESVSGCFSCCCSCAPVPRWCPVHFFSFFHVCHFFHFLFFVMFFSFSFFMCFLSRTPGFGFHSPKLLIRHLAGLPGMSPVFANAGFVTKPTREAALGRVACLACLPPLHHSENHEGRPRRRPFFQSSEPVTQWNAPSWCSELVTTTQEASLQGGVIVRVNNQLGPAQAPPRRSQQF